VENEKKEMWKRLKTFFNNSDVKMTKERYLNMCEQMGKEPDPEEIPPDWWDFPEVAQHAINIFNQLGDRLYPEIGYVGKDYTNLIILMEVHEVSDKDLVLEILNWLDSRAIKSSSEKLKAEYDKIKRKSKSK
jgi:hypothetical protein